MVKANKQIIAIIQQLIIIKWKRLLDLLLLGKLSYLLIGCIRANISWTTFLPVQIRVLIHGALDSPDIKKWNLYDPRGPQYKNFMLYYIIVKLIALTSVSMIGMRMNLHRFYRCLRYSVYIIKTVVAPPL